MQVNLEYSARKYKSARASNFGKCIGPSSRVIFKLSFIVIFKLSFIVKSWSHHFLALRDKKFSWFFQILCDRSKNCLVIEPELQNNKVLMNLTIVTGLLQINVAKRGWGRPYVQSDAAGVNRCSDHAGVNRIETVQGQPQDARAKQKINADFHILGEISQGNMTQ